MNTSPSKAISIIAPTETLNKAVQPKPTKNEVIAAMATVRHAELFDFRKSAQAENERLRALAEDKIRKHVCKSIRTFNQDISLGYISSSSGKPYSIRSEIMMDNLPEDIQKHVLAALKHEVPRVPDIKDIKNQIRESLGDMVGMEARVQALVNNPQTKKALESMLSELGLSENKKAIAI